MLEIESLAALDGVNDKMHEYEIYAAWREWHYRQALLQQVNRRQTGWRSEIFCASIMVLLSNTNTKQQKTAGKTRRLMAG